MNDDSFISLFPLHDRAGVGKRNDEVCGVTIWWLPGMQTPTCAQVVGTGLPGSPTYCLQVLASPCRSFFLTYEPQENVVKDATEQLFPLASSPQENGSIVYTTNNLSSLHSKQSIFFLLIPSMPNRRLPISYHTSFLVPHLYP